VTFLIPSRLTATHPRTLDAPVRTFLYKPALLLPRSVFVQEKKPTPHQPTHYYPLARVIQSLFISRQPWDHGRLGFIPTNNKKLRKKKKRKNYGDDQVNKRVYNWPVLSFINNTFFILRIRFSARWRLSERGSAAYTST